MAYRFQGFFVATFDKGQADAICHEALSTWPHARCRDITVQYEGVGVCWMDNTDQKPQPQDKLDAELGPWTRRFPHLTFVQVEATCFGGLCDYSGVVWRDGQTIWREADEEEGNAPLIRLLQYLGVDSPTGYFEPLMRGYFA